MNRHSRRARAKGKTGSSTVLSNQAYQKLLKLALKANPSPSELDLEDEDQDDADVKDDMSQDEMSMQDMLDALDDAAAAPGQDDEDDDDDDAAALGQDDEDQDYATAGSDSADGAATVSPEQLDALLDAALGIDDGDSGSEEEEEPVAAMSAARRASAQRKAKAARKVAQDLLKDLGLVQGMPASLKRTLATLVLKEKARELKAKADDRVLVTLATARKRVETERKAKLAQEQYIQSLVEEKLMNTRTGRAMSFVGQSNVQERKGYSGADRARMGSVSQLSGQYRRGTPEFKLGDVFRSIVNPEFRGSYLKEFKALGGATAASGGYIVPEYWSDDFIRLLRAKAVVRQLARIYPMASDTFHLPRQTGSGTALWVGENADTSAGLVDQTFDELVFLAKKLVAFSITSNELLADSSPSAEKIIRDDLLGNVQVAEDKAFLVGPTGGNNPVGLYSLLSTTNKLAGTGTANALIGEDLFRVLNRAEKANSTVDAWFTSADGVQVLRSLKDATGNFLFSQQNGVNGIQDWMQAPFGEDPSDYNVPAGNISGRPVYISNQIPSTVTIAANAPTALTGGTNTLIFGGQAKQLMIGQRKELEISASNVAGSAFQNDQTFFRAVLREDFKLGIQNSWAVCAFPIGN